MLVTSSPYAFSVVVDGNCIPKSSDIIFFGNRFYIIGSVARGREEREYYCSGCISIDVSIVGAYSALVVLQQQLLSAETERSDAESVRVTNENARVVAESRRETAEGERDVTFGESQAAREVAFSESEAARAREFSEAEACRTARLEEITSSFLVPWIVDGTISSGGRHFIPANPEDLVSVAKVRFVAGKRTYLHMDGYGTEEIIADDGECLVTRSNWKWKYEQ